MSNISMQALMSGALPEDLSLGVLRRALENDEKLTGTLRSLPSWKRDRDVRVRFLWTDPEKGELHDSVTLGVFRELAAKNLAKLVIDDGSGGVCAPEEVIA